MISQTHTYLYPTTLRKTIKRKHHTDILNAAAEAQDHIPEHVRSVSVLLPCSGPVTVPSVPSNRRCSINKEDQAGGPMNMDLTMDYAVTGSVKY